jgi:hypothetical protein
LGRKGDWQRVACILWIFRKLNHADFLQTFGECIENAAQDVHEVYRIRGRAGEQGGVFFAQDDFRGPGEEEPMVPSMQDAGDEVLRANDSRELGIQKGGGESGCTRSIPRAFDFL